ncbi:hypothetical protein D3C81_1126620 [compost metagenome]
MKILRHSKFDLAASQLSRALDQRQPGTAIFLVGPSGVGKTTLRHAVLKSVYGDPVHWPVGAVPVIETIATLPTNSYYNSKSLATELIDQLDRPTLPWIDAHHKSSQLNVFVSNIDGLDDRFRADRGRRRLSESEQWRTLERYIKARGCLVVSIDQATALLKNRKTKDPTDHMLHLMTFAEKAGVTLLLTGVPEVAELWNIHQELRRRVDVVWMPPYGEKSQGDRVEFAKLLSSFHRKYPQVPMDLFRSLDTVFLAASGGVYAELERLLVRSINRAADDGRSTVEKVDVEKSAHSQSDLEALWRGIHIFQNFMRAGSLDVRVSEIAKVWP